MKLRNKKTGEIQQIVVMPIIDGYPDEHEEVKGETSLKDFNEEWEDYEEPKEFWYIDLDGEIQSDGGVYEDTTTKGMKEIGNYFETKEEAEKAVEKLKAIKRLKDKGFRFAGWDMRNGDGGYEPLIGFELNGVTEKLEKYEIAQEITQDLDDCFGGDDEQD